jgi:hypothetical protein
MNILLIYENRRNILMKIKHNQIEDKKINIINELLLNEKRIEQQKILHCLDDIYKEVFMLRVFSD